MQDPIVPALVSRGMEIHVPADLGGSDYSFLPMLR